MTMNEEETNSCRCSYCQLLPTDPGNKLKRCSRCHNAWYHDAVCQRKHFPAHKKECRRRRQQQQQQSDTFDNINGFRDDNSSNNSLQIDNINDHIISSPQFAVQERNGRGKCLVALSKIQKGERIISSKLKSSSSSTADYNYDEKGKYFWRPLILPVLYEEYRTSRCALCFNQLRTGSTCSFDNGVLQKPNNSQSYIILFCSKVCLEIATRHHNLHQEEQAIRYLLEKGNGPPHILSTAILLYRILVGEKNDAKTRNKVHQLQSKKIRCDNKSDIDVTDFDTNIILNDEDHDDKSSSRLHTQGVIATVMGMLQYPSTSTNNYNPSMEYLVGMIHMIKVNGFSIFGGEEFITYGFGIFDIPSFMNHSCRPNAIQTFSLRQGMPPALYITAFQNISPNQEICISYIDAFCPRHIRRKRLEQGYYFLCTCELCDNNNSNNNIVQDDDTKTIGIRCQNCKSSVVILVGEGMMAPDRPNPVYCCTDCNNTDFESTLRVLREFENQIITKHGYSKITRRSSKEGMNETYETLKKICYMDSWYVQGAGEYILQNCLDELYMQRDNPLQEQHTAWRALKIAEELLSDASASSPTLTNDTSTASTSTFLKYQQLRYKAAKLRLFLIPDPRQSIQELKIVLDSLSPFFHNDHELITGLKACLTNAMM